MDNTPPMNNQQNDGQTDAQRAATKKANIILSVASSVLLAIGVNFVGFTDPEQAKAVLEQEGLKPLEVGGRSVFDCANGEKVSTKFTALNNKGVKVSGVVCRGILSDSSVIRYNIK